MKQKSESGRRACASATGAIPISDGANNLCSSLAAPIWFAEGWEFRTAAAAAFVLPLDPPVFCRRLPGSGKLGSCCCACWGAGAAAAVLLPLPAAPAAAATGHTMQTANKCDVPNYAAQQAGMSTWRYRHSLRCKSMRCSVCYPTHSQLSSAWHAFQQGARTRLASLPSPLPFDSCPLPVPASVPVAAAGGGGSMTAWSWPRLTRARAFSCCLPSACHARAAASRAARRLSVRNPGKNLAPAGHSSKQDSITQQG